MPVADGLINMTIDLWKKELLINWKTNKLKELPGHRGSWSFWCLWSICRL